MTTAPSHRSPEPELKPEELEARAKQESDWGEAWKLYQEALQKRQRKLFQQARGVLSRGGGVVRTARRRS